jgi:hypothetical protein
LRLCFDFSALAHCHFSVYVETYFFQRWNMRSGGIYGFGGMGDRFEPIFPPALIVSIGCY